MMANYPALWQNYEPRLDALGLVFFLRLTNSASNLGSASAHRHWGTLSVSVSAFSPPLFFLVCASKENSLIIRTLCVTTAPRGDTRRFGISCVADLFVVRNCSRLKSSLSFSQITGK